jgi:hypothetical protein
MLTYLRTDCYKGRCIDADIFGNKYRKTDQREELCLHLHCNLSRTTGGIFLTAVHPMRKEAVDVFLKKSEQH